MILMAEEGRMKRKKERKEGGRKEGKKRERKGTFFCPSRIERSWEGLPREKQKRGEEKNVSERKG